MMKNYRKKILGFTPLIVLFLSLGACQKEEEAPLEQVSLALPANVALQYGEEANVALPATLLGQSDTEFALEFNETENVQTSGQTRLHDQMAAAITIDRQAGHIHINSAALYPNAAVSSINQAKIPSEYQVTVLARTSRGEVGRQTVSLTITAASLQVSGVDNTQQVPFAYVLYSDQGASFELTANDLDLRATQWFLPTPVDPAVSLSGNKIQFSAQAGDANRAEEHTYDLVPALQKDGFTIASTSFRVVFIPQIKFFFGTYYPEYNLTILQNFLHIALSNGYLSAAPTLYPARYKSTFSLVAVEKDGQTFADEAAIFSVNEETGAVTVKANTQLKAGQYKIQVKAVTTTGMQFFADLTLAMEAG